MTTWVIRWCAYYVYSISRGINLTSGHRNDNRQQVSLWLSCDHVTHCHWGDIKNQQGDTIQARSFWWYYTDTDVVYPCVFFMSIHLRIQNGNNKLSLNLQDKAIINNDIFICIVYKSSILISTKAMRDPWCLCKISRQYFARWAITKPIHDSGSENSVQTSRSELKHYSLNKTANVCRQHLRMNLMEYFLF